MLSPCLMWFSFRIFCKRRRRRKRKWKEKVDSFNQNGECKLNEWTNNFFFPIFAQLDQTPKVNDWIGKVVKTNQNFDWRMWLNNEIKFSVIRDRKREELGQEKKMVVSTERGTWARVNIRSECLFIFLTLLVFCCSYIFPIKTLLSISSLYSISQHISGLKSYHWLPIPF